MGEGEQKKILVALDGSERSKLTIEYLTKIKPFEDMGVVLFNVFNGVPESYWDLEREPKSVKSVKYVRAWEVQQLKDTQEFMDKARQALVRSGFPNEKIDIKIQHRKKGVARDILQQAHHGYEAVVSRRRGMGRLPGLILGSVSMKLLENLSFTPLILAGRKQPGRRYMIAMDGSEGAMKATEFAGSFLAGNDVEFFLLHVIRGGEKSGSILSTPDIFVDDSRKTIAKAFLEAKNRLVAKGFDPDKVTSQIVTGARSRAGAIVDEGKKAHVGTIIMGRKGLSRTPDFSIGRVTQKVVFLARERSIWIIN